jgi:hypothetical protein
MRRDTARRRRSEAAELLRALESGEIRRPGNRILWRFGRSARRRPVFELVSSETGRACADDIDRPIVG